MVTKVSVAHWLPRLESVLFLSAFISVVNLGPRLLNQDGDLGRHITIGTYILNNHAIPTRDIFSHTMAGNVMTPHEWLAQIFFALTHQYLGLSGVVWISGLIIATTWWLVFKHVSTRNQLPLASLVLVLISFAAASLHFLARPHLFTLLFFTSWIIILEKIRQNQNIPLWISAGLMLLWANTHGAFIAGFVCWSAYIFETLLSMHNNPTANHALKKFASLGVASFSATLINPAGWRLWQTSLGYIGNRYLVSHTQEYLPPNFHHPSTWPFLFLMGISLIILTSLEKPIPVAHRLLLGGWTIMALYSARNIPLYALATTIILGEAITEAFQNSPWRHLEERMNRLGQNLRERLWIPLGILAFSFLFLSSPLHLERNRFDPLVFPVEAIDWLANHPQKGNMFNKFTWGGYLLYRLWPDYKVFIDGQTDFYGEQLTREYEAIITLSPQWQSLLQAHQVSWIIHSTDSALIQTVSLLEDWECPYQDHVATICHRRLSNPPNQDEAGWNLNHP